MPVFLEESTAVDSLHGFFDVGALVPLWRTTAYGRAFVDLELVFALFVAAAWIAIWVDRPDRDKRSIAEILAGIGVVAAAAAVVLIPGAAGHAAQTSPRGLAVALDWLHVASGSLWVGGLAGLVLLWATLPHARRVAGLAVVVPRFSNVALVSVAVLLGSGIWASVLKLPILSALWTTSYGQTILVKASLLAVAMGFGAVNFAVNRPRLVAARARPEVGPPAVSLLGVITSGEVLVVIGAIAAAAVLTSLAPPSKYLGQESGALAKVGPGPVAAVVQKDGYTLKVIVDPNKAAAPNRFALEITKNGRPVTGRERDDDVRDARHGDGEPGVSAHRDLARRLLAAHPGARDGRPLGAVVQRDAQGRTAVHRRRRRQGLRMTGVRLAASLLAFALGAVAATVALVLLGSAI